MIDLKSISDSLNDFNFSTIIPSTGEVINGRPYTVKDEFKLTQLQTIDDKKIILDTLFNIVKDKYYSLTENQISQLTLVDVQYLLAQLKKNSDDGEIPIIVTCTKCEKEFEHSLNLTKIDINNNNFKKNIKITSDKLQHDLTITMNTMRYIDVSEKYLKNSNNTGDIENILIDCIESISFGDEMSTEFTTEELKMLLSNIPHKYYSEFTTFLSETPELIYKDNVQCTHCGEKNTIGIDDFFYLIF